MTDSHILPDVTQNMVNAQDLSGPTPDHIRSVFHRYAALFTAADAHSIAQLYSADAVVRDPVTAPAVHGRDGIQKWYQACFDAAGHMDMSVTDDVRVAGRYAAANFTVFAGAETTPFRSDTLDVMVFDDEGLITSMTAYWGPTNIHMLDPA